MRTSNTKQSRFTLNASLLTLLFLCGLAPVLQAATGTNIQSTGTTASWTDNANWNGASYPGFGATETAFLTTNMVGGGGYTNILNATLPNALTTLSLSNFSGTATLIVTNNSLTAGTVNLGTGGRLQVEVAAHPSFTPLTVTTLNMYGLDPKITINNGARLATTTALIFTNGSDAATGLVVCAAPGANGSAWDSATAITIGSGGVTGKVLTIDGGGAVGGLVVTHGGADLNIGGSGVNANNSLNLINGARLNLSSVAVDTPGLFIGRLGATNTGNRLTVDNAVLEGSSLRIHVGNAPASTGAGPNGGNTMVVTNGGSVNAIIVNVGGYYSSGGINYGSSNNTLMVVGTNSSGVRSSITLGSASATWSGIGNAAGAVSNLAVIDNGVVAIGGNLTVGRGAQANFNQLVVTNGGQLVTSGTLFYIGGAAAGASGNSVLLSGAGSLWNMGASTRLEISSPGCTNNTMTVEGGAVLSNVNALFVGNTSISNELRILNGGRVQVANEVRAPYSGGASNKIIVDNATLLCGELSVGTGSGGGNNILITNGASVTATSLYVGRTSAGAGGSNNWITVAGTNSSGARATLSLANGAIGVGSFNAASGFDNRLTIGRGGIMPDVGGVVVGVSGVTTGNVLSIDGGVMTNVSLDVRNNNSLIFSGGTLAMGSATCSNSVAVPVFNVGDGTQAATLLALTGGGTFDFFGGMLINSNATVGGIGTFTCRVPGGSALTLTNGATVAPGLGGPGFLTVLKDLVWSGGGIYQCDITDVAGGEGIGWDSLVVQSSLTLTNASAKQMVIKLDSRGGNTANFNPTQNYSLKIASYVAVTNFVAADFLVDTNAFLPVSSGTWSVGALNGGLYVMYNGGGVAPTADYTWAVPSNGLWSASQNWTNPATAPADGGNAAWTLTFGGNNTAYVSTNDRTPGFQLSNLVFSSSSLTATNLISGSNLVFAGVGGGIQQRDVGAYRLSNSITLNTDLTFSGPGLGSVILHTNISGSGGLIKRDAGTLVLGGSNTFTGPVLVDGNGTLQTTTNRALGRQGSVTVSNGTLFVNAGTAVPFEFGQPGYSSRAALVTGSGSLWTNNAIFKLGTNSSFNTLTIANTGRLFNAAAVSVIGDTAPSNTAIVKDGGLWSLGASTLTVGTGGTATGNLLRVENGGLVTNATLWIGASGAQFNRMVVTNSGKVYARVDSYIGNSASNNTVTVKDGGLLDLGAGTLYVGIAVATGNVLQIDAGGVLTNGGVRVGQTGSQFNRMMVTNGGSVYASGASYVGYSASNNTAVVQGGHWNTKANDLTVGYAGTGNVLQVDGGTVTNINVLVVGDAARSGGNSLLITNGGFVRSADGAVGRTSFGNSLIVEGTNNAGRVSEWSATAPLTIGTAAGSTGNWMRVGGGGVAGFTAVTVGSGGTAQFSVLTITNGGRLTSSLASAIGATSSSNNTVVIAGSDAGGQKALWSAGGQTITVGSGTGTGNVLRIGNGGMLSNAIVSFSTPTPNNAMVVENGGKVYAGLYPAYTVSGVTNPSISMPDGSLWEPGATDWNGGGKDLLLGYSLTAAQASNNALTLNGRTFTNFATAYVGFAANYDNVGANYNTLVITNNAKLYSTAGTVGFTSAAPGTQAAIGNRASVIGGSGVTSLWDCGGGPFSVMNANNGYSNNLTVDGAGFAGSAILTNASTLPCYKLSSVFVTNGGVVYLNSYPTLYSDNSLLITKGSRMSVSVAGYSKLSLLGTNDLLLVSGSNSLLEGYAATIDVVPFLVLYVTNNTLRIEDGAVVTNMAVNIGGYYNIVTTVTTPTANRLNITGGAKLYSVTTPSYIGGTAGSIANTGLVSGVDSLWDLGAKNLTMSGRSNVLTIADAAVVTNVGAVIQGGGATAGENYNQLVITGGGKLYSSGNSTLANNVGQLSNTVLITGNSSAWNLGTGNLTIGAAAGTATGNVLTIDQGATVDNIGTLTITSNNAVLLNGGTLGMAAATVGQGSIFNVGDGTQPAMLKSLLAGGICRLTNGVWVKAGATLTGVGTVAGGVPGVILTNGAILSAGLNGVGTLTLSNTTWYGGATNVVDITAVDGTAGVGFDLVNINTQLTMTANSKKFVVKMDSLLGSANFQTGRDYLLKFMSCSTSAAAFNLGDFEVDATAFVPGGTWWVTNIGYSLYLATTGGTPVTSSYVWDSTKNGAWDVNGNWLGGAAPNPGDVTNVLEFGGSGAQTYTATNNLGNDYPLKTLRLTSTSTGTNYLFGQSLLFSGTGSGITLDGSGWTTSTNRMNWTAPLLLGGSGAGGGIILSNCLVGTGGVTVASGGTYVLAVSNAFRGDITLDCSGDGKLRVNNVYGLGSNSVTVSNGTLHINQAASIFGNTNQANLRGLVTGVSSVWSNNGTLTVGTLGATNVSLTINAGSTMYGTTVTIGGPGSTNSSLLLTNGGRIRAAAVVGDQGGVRSTAILTGAGSLWQTPGGLSDLSVGATGAGVATGNVLRVESGAVITNVATGVIGYNQSGNSLIITNGGKYYSPRGAVTVGAGTASNNSVVVSGSGSRLDAYLNNNNSFIVGNGTPTVICSNNVVTVSDGGLIQEFTMIFGAGNNYRSKLVVDNGTVGPCGGYALTFGYPGNGNEGIVSNGGSVLLYVTLAATSGGTNNTLKVFDSTSRLAGYPSGAASAMLIGNAGNSVSNQVLIDAGMLTNYATITVGVGTNTFGNSLILTNGGRAWMGTPGLTIGQGNYSGPNWVGVYDNAMIDSKNYAISIGTGLGTGSNRLEVGIGGSVTNVGTLTVGNPTSSNQLTIIGGTLSVSNLVCSNVNNTIAFSAGKMNLRGAYVSNTVPLVVGDGAQAATLSLVAGGTSIFAHGLTITNKATLTGAGAITGNTTVYGTNSPGIEGIGVITNSGNVTLAASAVSRFEIGTNTTAGSGWDHLVLTGGGTLTVGGKLIPILTGGFSPTNTMSFVIMTNTTASVSGSFANETSGKVNVYTNDSVTSLVGTFNVTVSNSQYVVLTNFKPPLASGTIFKFR